MMELHQIVQTLAKHCLKHGMKIAAAESCTGGWLAHEIVSLAGCSAWFEGSIVSYTNEAKTHWLNVPAVLIEHENAVSEAVARAMLDGVLATSTATHGIAITGFAGPKGGSVGKPVGLVWFAWGDRMGHVVTRQKIFPGDRDAVRKQAVLLALNGLLELFPNG